MAIRSRALTIRRPRARTRRREVIPRLAVAIRHPRVPTPRPAAAIVVGVQAAAAVVGEARTVVEVAEARTVVEVGEAPTAVEVAEAPTVVEVAEVHTAVEAPLTATNNLFARHKGPAR